jgi:hypothetical protein
MKLVDTMVQRTSSLLAAARGAIPAVVPARLRRLMAEGSCELTRAAAAGAVLFGIAGAGLGARGGFAAFRIESAAAGATVSVGWGNLWFAYAAGGAALGALLGAAALYAARTWLDARRTGLALLAVGAAGGILAGATWGDAVARERVVEVRAQQSSARVPAATGPQRVTIVNGPVRLDGTVERDMNVPLLSFMLLGGAAVGMFAARGVAEPVMSPRDESDGSASSSFPLT